MGDVGKHRGGGVSRHRGRFRAVLNVSGARVSLGVYDTREEAQAAVDAAMCAVDGGAKISGAQTVGEWGSTWLDRREVGGRVAGIRQERSTWRMHIASQPIAELPLRVLTRGHVARWVDHLTHDARQVQTVRRRDDVEHRQTDKRLSAGSVRHAIRLLRGSLKAAVRAGLIEENPARDAEAPKPTADESTGDGVSWTWLTAAEVARVLEAPEAPLRHRLCWTVAVYTGLRRGELRALQWRDVDLAGASLRVRSPKNRKAREVPLLPPALDALERWRDTEPGIGSAHVWRPMRRRKGAPLAGKMSAHWDLGWRRHGPAVLGRPVRVHDLRHTCASHLVQGTWGRSLSLYEAREWLGHSSIQVTQRYAHLAPEGLKSAAKEMARFWAPKGAEEENE